MPLIDNAKRIDLKLTDIVAGTNIDLPFECLRGAQVELIENAINRSVRLMVRCQIAFEPVDQLSVRHPSDWRSHFFHALATRTLEWLRELEGKHSSIRVWLLSRVHRAAKRRVAWTVRNLELRRLYPDVVVEGRRSFVQTFVDGQPLSKQSAAVSDYLVARREVLMAMMSPGWTPEQAEKALDKMLEAASRTRWTKR